MFIFKFCAFRCVTHLSLPVLYRVGAVSYPTISVPAYRRPDHLVDEVDAEEMQDEAADDEVGKGPEGAVRQNRGHVRCKRDIPAYRSGDTAGKSLLFASVVWIRNDT